jgi:uncharacterized membrane protein YidH (DUF202 family)
MVSITLVMKLLRRTCSALCCSSRRDLALTSSTMASIMPVTAVICCSRVALAWRRASTSMRRRATSPRVGCVVALLSVVTMQKSSPT